MQAFWPGNYEKRHAHDRTAAVCCRTASMEGKAGREVSVRGCSDGLRGCVLCVGVMYVVGSERSVCHNL